VPKYFQVPMSAERRNEETTQPERTPHREALLPAPVPTPPPPDPLAGSGYKAIRRLGAGGMGEVFEAIHVGLSKPVVVKLLHQAIARDPRAADRLRVEAQTLASIDSRHLVAVSDIGCTSDGRPFFVMERLRGTTLRKALAARGPLDPVEAIAWTIQVLDGLGAAHRVGIVHRDVKLDNVFLCDATSERGPVVKVLDFGIAKVLHGAGLPFPAPKYATQEGHILGTPRYCSPEQIRFDRVDERTDVYAVGVLLYTLLAGRGPFHGSKDVIDLLDAHVHEIPPPLSQVAPQPIPVELEEAIAKALAKRPAHRFTSAETFAHELWRQPRAPNAAHPIRVRAPPIGRFGYPRRNRPTSSTGR
jgi:serine/threonine-protein kinase